MASALVFPDCEKRIDATTTSELIPMFVKLKPVPKVLVCAPLSPNTTSLVELGTPPSQLAALFQLLLTSTEPFHTCADCRMNGMVLVAPPDASRLKVYRPSV